MTNIPVVMRVIRELLRNNFCHCTNGRTKDHSRSLGSMPQNNGCNDFGNLYLNENYVEHANVCVKHSLANDIAKKYTDYEKEINETVKKDSDISLIQLLKDIERKKITQNVEAYLKPANKAYNKDRTKSLSPKKAKLPKEEIKLEQRKKLQSENGVGLLANENTTVSENRTLPNINKEIFDCSISEEKYGRRLSVDQYEDKIKDLLKERKVQEAINVLEIEMVAQNVKPNNFCFNMVINGCGKVGYSKKAFDLFHKMKQISVNPTKHTYTGLFNSCANFKSEEMKEYSLRQANNLKNQIKNKNIVISQITYHSMIKAFGRLGETSVAFEIVDEMLINKMKITTETLNFLLQACISDKANGFRHAIKVWRRMRMLNLRPCIYSYNLLLRCMKECEGGDPKLLEDILETPPSKKLQKQIKAKEVKLGKNLQAILTGVIEPPLTAEDRKNAEEDEKMFQILANNERVEVNLQDDMELEITSTSYIPLVPTKKNVFPELLDKHFSKGLVTNISSLSKPEERLAVLGGPRGVLRNMNGDKVEPTMSTFTFLLESLPNSLEAEEALLSSMEHFDVKEDVMFFNMLIKKRNLELRKQDAKQTLELMTLHKIEPDLITFGCLAIGCTYPGEGITLLRDMSAMSIRPSEAILSTLLLNGLKHNNYEYALDILRKYQHANVIVSQTSLGHLEKARKDIRENLLAYDLQKNTTVRTKKQMIELEEGKLFLHEYRYWLNRKSKFRATEHPWTQFGYKEVKGSKVIAMPQ